MNIKKRLLSIILILMEIGAQGQTPKGWWLGMLEEHGLPLNMQITEQDGHPAVLMYSPAQQTDPMPSGSYSFSGDTLRYESKPLGLKMKLIYRQNDSSWSCSFTQGFLASKLTLYPTDTLYQLKRPQTPKAPFPYDEIAARVERKKAGVVLTGTLTMPYDIDPGFSRGKKTKYPAVVLVSGSGQQNRDEELMGHKPFLVLADYLTRQGIAVLRYDDRGTGGSTGDVANATTLDFADDAEAMMEWLRQQPGIDPDRVGIVGHSEGGLIAPIVASRNRHTGFIVLLAGPGYSGGEILLQQNEALWQAQGADTALISLRLRFLSALFAGDSNADQLLTPYSKEQLKEAGLNKGGVMMLRQQLENPWMKTFISLNPKPYLKKTRCPILAINGEKDLQVPSLKNLLSIQYWAPQAEVHPMPGLNHLMQHCKTGLPNEYMLIEETMSPEVMELVAKFILRTK